MDYKVLIKLYVPEIEETYEMYIPINKSVGEMVELLTTIVHDLSGVYPVKKNANIVNRRTGQFYLKDHSLRSTDIRNATELILY